MGLSFDDTSIAKYFKNLGIEEGKKEEKRALALKMLKDGLDLSLIAKYTGLSLEEIQRLQK